MTDDKNRGGTGGDPAGGADPGGTRPTKPADQGARDTDRNIGPGDRDGMDRSDPIKP